MLINEILERAVVIPVLEVEELASAEPLAKALHKGGLKVVELTLRTPCALNAIRVMKDAAPDLIVGMGTIRSGEDIERSLAAGAEFLVSPGASTNLLAALASAGAPALPGVATASEAMTASDAGFSAMKFFPAEPAGGLAYLKALAGPLPEVIFCPTGGISADQAPRYLTLPNVACVGGSWVATRRQIADGDWAAITQNAAKAAQMPGAHHLK